MMKALAGDDDNPAVAGFDPDVSARALHDQRRRHRRRATQLQHAGVHGRARRRHRPGGRRHRRRTRTVQPGGFVFQDSEADVQARVREEPRVRARPRAVGDATRPSPISHLGNTAPEFVPTTFAIVLRRSADRRGQREARRSAPCTAHWQRQRRPRAVGADARVQGRRSATATRASTTTRCAAQITGMQAGRQREVWFTGRAAKTSDAFTYTVESDSGNRCC